MKRFYVFIIALSVMVLAACGGCNRNVTPDPDFPPVDTPEVVVEPDLSLIEQTILVTDDWIFSGKPSITFQVKNPNEASVRVEAKMRISTDQKQEVEIVTDSVDIAGNSTKEFVMTTTSDLAPGFYRAVCWVNNKTARSFFFGIDPFDIVSAPDKQADYDAFWTTTKNQLAATPMDAVLTEITDHSSATRKVYLVEMKSIADGLTGDPVTIRGYYCEPQDGQQHPVIMHFYGYDTQGSKSKCECPQGGTSQYAEFYLSHRGQYLNNRPASTKNPGVTEDCVNIYGDWFAYNFGDKDGYYYRGAFMDCVRAVDFMASRPTSDMTRLFAEGSSQGGALSYAAAALSNYPFTAIAPNVAFLGDFPDYFQIVGWPAETAKQCQKKLGMSDEQMYAFLSYFDTKNLAMRISCAVLATSGLQDGTCPPHTNLAPFNNLLTSPENKEYHFYPEMQHDYPKNWYSMIMNFFKERM